MVEENFEDDCCIIKTVLIGVMVGVFVFFLGLLVGHYL